MDFSIEFAGTPLWMWLTFLLAVAGLLAFDLGLLNRKPRELEVRESLRLSAFYIALGLCFGLFVWWSAGAESAMLYYTGFIVEKSLSLDNVFVIAMIFATLGIPRAYQHRVLFWGILGAILLRGIMIGLGAGLVAEFSWILYVFGVILVVTAVKMLVMEESEPDPSKSKLLAWLRKRLPLTDRIEGQAFQVRERDPQTGRMVRLFTPLFLALVLVEATDLLFAVDSIPAIFAITTDPFIVYTSNIFAILGLRALYFALAAVIHRFRYVRPALALVLLFIGGKILALDIIGHIPPALSVAITLGILAGGIGLSLSRTRGEHGAAAAS